MLVLGRSAGPRIPTAGGGRTAPPLSSVGSGRGGTTSS